MYSDPYEGLAVATITGTAVTYGQPIDPDDGGPRLLLRRGAITGLEDYRPAPFCRDHGHQPIGWLAAHHDTPTGLYVSLVVDGEPLAQSAGRCAHAGAARGLSVKVDRVKGVTRGGVLYVATCRLVEVSLVAHPCCPDAQVDQVQLVPAGQHPTLVAAARAARGRWQAAAAVRSRAEAAARLAPPRPGRAGRTTWRGQAGDQHRAADGYRAHGGLVTAVW